MIKNINIENYKAFKNGSLEIKPITILLGSNSAGKSSLIQSILMLSQTLSLRRNRQNALLLNGDLIKMGETKNIFHNKKITSQISFSFDIEEITYEELYEQIKENIFETFYSLDRIYSIVSESPSRLPNRIRYNLTKEFENEDFVEIFKKLTSLKIKINKQAKNISSEDFSKIMSMYFRKNMRYRKNNFFLDEEKKITIDFAPYKYAYEFIKNLSKINVDSINFKYSFRYNKNSKKIEISGFVISAKEIVLLEYIHQIGKKGKRNILKSDLINPSIINKYASKFNKSIDLTNITLKGDIFHRKSENNYFVNFLYDFFRNSLNPINESLNIRNINYINPLRAYPKRYYFKDEVINSHNSSSIDSIQLIDLFRERIDIKKSVNEWMKKFHINIDIAQLEEVIHKIKVNHSGLSLDLTDVGFGISQVMPIIAQCYLSRPNSITLIEQPEIHLHPKMQADLADLFIETSVSKEFNKNFIIETHSEYLLKRLRRRISEGKISSENVAIYFIHPRDSKNTSASIESIKINETGDFKWPSDFYADDLKDTIEFLKNQIK